MKYTNKYNLCSPIYNAITYDDYDRGNCDYSTTELNSPPRIVYLRRKYRSKIIVDIMDRMAVLDGKETHAILEKHNKIKTKEKRLFITVGGVKISGQYDRFENGILQDYKKTKTWEWIISGVKADRIQQLNIYAEMLRQNDVKVDELQAIFFFKEWSKLEVYRKIKTSLKNLGEDYSLKNIKTYMNSVAVEMISNTIKYPLVPTMTVNVEMWEREKTIEYIRERINLHKNYDHSLCSPEERWNKERCWAVMKGKNKRAIKLHTIEEDAINHAMENVEYFVEYREGLNQRCEFYCELQKFCEAENEK